MINLNEYAYQLKEQGLSYIQIGFVMKELDLIIKNNRVSLTTLYPDPYTEWKMPSEY